MGRVMSSSVCAYCGNEIMGMSIPLDSHPTFSFLNFGQREFCSEQCRSKFLLVREEKDILNKIAQIEASLNETKAELNTLAAAINGYLSIPPEDRDPSALDNIKGTFESLSAPDLSGLKKIADALRKLEPNNLNLQEIAARLESMKGSLGMPYWTDDLNGLAEQCETASDVMGNLAGRLASITLPKPQ